MVINNTVNSGLLSKNQNLAQGYQATKPKTVAPKPVTWGIPNTPVSQVSSPNMGTKTTTPQIGKISPLTTAPKPVVPVATQTDTNKTLVSTPSQGTTSVAGLVPSPQQNKEKIAPPAATAPAPAVAGAPLNNGLNFSSLVGSLVGAASPTGTQKGLISDLRRTAQGNASIGQDARNISKTYSDEIARIGQLGAGAVAGNLSTGSNVVGSGNAAIASQSVSARMNALANANNAALQGTAQQLTGQGQQATAFNSALAGANTQQGQQITGLGTAAGYTQPIQLPYSNQYIDPMTGQPVGGGATGGSLQNAVQTIAQQVQNGTMSYDQGVQALQGYGQGGMNALQQALGPNFSSLQSNAQAAANQAATLQTGTMGGELTKQADTVVQHMQTLKTAYQNLTAQFGIPALNQGINWFKGKIGDGELQSYKIALTNVRDELAKILGGGTSTDGTRATAESLLPDNMSPDQIDSAIKTASELMQSKINEYTRAPQYGNSGGAGGVVNTSAGAINTDW